MKDKKYRPEVQGPKTPAPLPVKPAIGSPGPKPTPQKPQALPSKPGSRPPVMKPGTNQGSRPPVLRPGTPGNLPQKPISQKPGAVNKPKPMPGSAKKEALKNYLLNLKKGK